jgi:hypothetical protein
MNKHLKNYQTYQKFLARKERLIRYLDNRPESYSLDEIRDFLEDQSKKLLGANWLVRAEDIQITEDEVRVKFSWPDSEKETVVLPLWFLDDPDRYYRERREKQEKAEAAKKEERELWEGFKKEHGWTEIKKL